MRKTLKSGSQELINLRGFTIVSNKTLRVFGNATAIITGGASGIGRALAEELGTRGCKVVLADLQIELAEEVASEIRAAGKEIGGKEIGGRP